MKILCIGDIFGPKGVEHASKNISEVLEQINCDMIIANIENAAIGGRGPSEQAIKALQRKGVHVFTGGNHSFDIVNNYFLYDSYPQLLRPYNFPSSLAGLGVHETNIKGKSIVTINIQLRVFMREMLRCPFASIDEILQRYSIKKSIIIVDCHGEATSEKLCFAHYCDGRISALFGTHTHVQTADSRIFPQGTGYITDLGMVGPLQSSIGKTFSSVTRNLLQQTPGKMEDEIEGPYVFSAIIYDINDTTHLCDAIQTIYW